MSIKDKFATPRAVVSLRFFNCFRLFLEKAEDPDDSWPGTFFDLEQINSTILNINQNHANECK